jgi:dolichol-phosphate mannosyltransferase
VHQTQFAAAPHSIRCQEGIINKPAFPAQPATALSADRARPRISIIVPTINEAGNLEPLTARIAAAMGELSYEILVIDDGSKDGTTEVCRELSHRHPLTLHVRPAPVAGLSGAVLYGFARAQGDILVVMDADLQHPPEALPTLIAPVLSGDADFVIGSRRAPGGGIGRQWGAGRRLNSAIGRWLAVPLVGAVRDPLSGFFALRRDTLGQASHLDALGYKIGLELLCKCPVRQVAEVPIDFGVRRVGRSKLTIRQQINYLRHLARLYRISCSASRRARIACEPSW